MKTNHEHFINTPDRKGERGNALIYVLIAIALFAALSMTLGRQTDTGEAGAVSDEQAELYATQLINYVAQVKSVVDQMLFTGSQVSDLDFTLPGEAGFDTNTTHKVYHPRGGGLTPGVLPEAVQADTATPLTPGWYLGRFNNVEWTKLGPGNTEGVGGAEAPYEEVILVAYEISEDICAKINLKITGDTTIPSIAGGTNLYNLFVDPAIHGIGSAAHLTTANCADCEGYSSLCVERGGAYGFYNIIEDQ